jgi:hypothetical protein
MKKVRTRLLGAAVAMAACGAVASPAHGSASANDLAGGLGHCNGRDAVAAIDAGKFERNVAVLGDAIFLAGTYAARTGRARCFGMTVAWAFIRGGVPFSVANAAFGRAGATAARRGLTAVQLMIGGDTVTRTNAAYLA